MFNLVLKAGGGNPCIVMCFLEIPEIFYAAIQFFPHFHSNSTASVFHG